MGSDGPSELQRSGPSALRIGVAGAAAASPGIDWAERYAAAALGALQEGFAIWAPSPTGALELVHRAGAALPVDGGAGVAVAPGAALGPALARVRGGGPAVWLRAEDPALRARLSALPGGAVSASWLRVEAGVEPSPGGAGALAALATELEGLMHTISAVEPAASEDRAALVAGRLGLARAQWRLRGLAQRVPAAPPMRLDRALERLRPEITARVPDHVELRWAVQEPLPEARLSPGMLGFILHELVSNALQAMDARPPAPPETGCVLVSVGLMRLRAQRQWQGLPLAAGGYVYLEVVDDGLGFSGARALDPFGAAGGEGLGLTAVRGLALAVGGGARLRSVGGRGTVVQVALPVVTPAERAVRVWIAGEPDATEVALLSALAAAGVRAAPRSAPGAPNDGLLPVVACARGPGDPRWRDVERLIEDDTGVPVVLWAPGNGTVRPGHGQAGEAGLELVRDRDPGAAVAAVLRMLDEAGPA